MTRSPNPLVPGWYADPEARFFDGQYWIYATRSYAAFADQTNLDAFSSPDLVTWTKHTAIVDLSGFPWVTTAVWAPSTIEHRGRYYLVFASNDIQSDAERGGLEIAVSDSPAGPFRAFLDRPLVDHFVHGAQPIDAHFFADEGALWLYWGGWRHCCVARLNDEVTGFVPFDDGTWAREITPPDYVEAPCLLKRRGVYYFMWSSGNWTDASYRVSYATGLSPLGPFEPRGTILQAQLPLAEGPGHHGWLNLPGTDLWRIVYHRRPVGDPDRGHRYLCLDELNFDDQGNLLPVVMTGADHQDHGGPSMLFEHRDIGTPSLAGRQVTCGTGFDLSASGADIWETSDQFGFVSRRVTGDFDLVVRLASLEAVDLYTKAGLMARDGLGASAAHVFLLCFPHDAARNKNSGMIEAQYRPATGAPCTALYPPKHGVGAPEFPVAFPNVWMKLGRRGARWTLSVGSDGQAWSVYAEFDLALGAELEVGPAFTSHGAKLGVAQFRDLAMTTPSS